MQRPMLDSAAAHVNQRLNNVTRAVVARELARIAAGNGRPAFSRGANGTLMFTDRDARGQERTREVLPLEDRDAAFQAIVDARKHPGLGRFHELVQQQYAGVGRRKSAWWFRNSANAQLHSRMRGKNVVRPVLAAKPGHVQIDLTDHTSKPSGAFKWCFNAVDVFSRYLWVVPMRNKEAPTCARALRTIAAQGEFAEWATLLQSDQDPSFKAGVFQEAVREVGLKHIFSKTYSSTSQAKVERVQQTVVRSMVGKWKTATGRADFHAVLPALVATYNGTTHSVTRVEPEVALRLGRAGDQELLAYVRANDYAAARKSMGVDAHPLEVGQKCRVSIFAISSEARRSRETRKASQESNWSRALFTVRSRSRGTPVSQPEYRIAELGFGRKRPIFYRHELLGPIDTERLRDDVAPPPPKDTMASLEESALADIQAAAEDAKDAADIARAVEKPPSAADARFVGAKVRKVFTDGALQGTVKTHVVLPMPVDEKDDDDDGERWLVEFANGRQQLVRPDELLDILAGDDGDGAKEKQADDALANDPLLGRKLRAPDAEDTDVGTILRVALKKPKGKKKRARHYYVEWRSPEGELTLTREYERFELAPFLMAP